MTPETCPNCGADLPRRAKVCPECGSDENTGWSETAHAEGLGLPDDSFNYEEFVEREFGEKKAAGGLKWYWVTAAVAVVLAFLWMFLR